MNIQPQTTSEVSNTETVIAYNEDLDLPPPQDILNVFASSDLSSHSSFESNKYKCAWMRGELIRSSILSARKCLEA